MLQTRSWKISGEYKIELSKDEDGVWGDGWCYVTDERPLPQIVRHFLSNDKEAREVTIFLPYVCTGHSTPQTWDEPADGENLIEPDGNAYIEGCVLCDALSDALWKFFGKQIEEHIEEENDPLGYDGPEDPADC